MNRHLAISLGFSVSVALAGSAAAQQAPEGHHATKPTVGFSQLKTLVGDWVGKTPDGKTVNLSYSLGSGGSTLIEKLTMGTEPEMVTVYHADGDHLAVTHYCSSGNQPQMRTSAITGPTKEFSFDFVRATNLETPATGHMHHLTVKLTDQNHMAQEWTWQQDGKAQVMPFQFTRKS